MDDTLARRAIREAFGSEPDSIERLGGGLANHVWKFSIGGRFRVLRLAPEAGLAAGSTYWLKRLEPANLPIPRLEKNGITDSRPWTILSLVPGQDLGVVYDTLTRAQKRSLAESVIACQQTLSRFPRAPGFGFLSSYEDQGAKPRWIDVVKAHLDRSRHRLGETGSFPAANADTVEALLPAYGSALEAIEPTPFFDDATTKNVLVQGGTFSGIVDLDWICFGDRLYATALTRMSLLAAGRDTDYADFLVEADRVSGDRLRLLDFYTLVFCLDFMSEVGMAFNRAAPEPADPAYCARLGALFESLRARCENDAA